MKKQNESPMTQNDLHKYTVIKVNNEEIGRVQAIKDLTDDNDDSSAPIKGIAWRSRVDREKIKKAFNKGFFHRNTQSLPLQFIENDKIIQNVWLIEIDYLYTVDNWIICSKFTFEAEKIV